LLLAFWHPKAYKLDLYFPWVSTNCVLLRIKQESTVLCGGKKYSIIWGLNEIQAAFC
jgi:hypothetical protein